MLKKLIIFILLFLFIGVPKVSLAQDCIQDYKILNLSFDDSSKLILINGNSPTADLKIEGGRLSSPPRGFVDIYGAVLTTPAQVFTLKSSAYKDSNITEVRLAQFSTNPNVVRVVFVGKTDESIAKIKLIRTNNSLALQLNDFKPEIGLYSVIFTDKAESVAEIAPSTTAKRYVGVAYKLPPKKTYIENIKRPANPAVIKSDNLPKNAKYFISDLRVANNQLFLSGSGAIKIDDSFVLENPRRIVYDLSNAGVQSKDFFKDYILSSTDKAKVGQFSDDIVRIVITTNNPQQYRAVISPDLQSLIIGQEGKIKYSAFPDAFSISKISNASVQNLSDRTTLSTISFDKPVIHSVRKLSNKLIFSFYNVLLPDSKALLKLKNIPAFKNAEISNIGAAQTGISVSIPVKNTNDIETGLGHDGKTIYLKLTEKAQQAPSSNICYMVIGPNRKVVIDAGHGGKDAGAVNGTVYEKDIVLDVTKRIESYLKESGINVVMTRPTDDFVSLKQRVVITNCEKPDIFVSVHINSSVSSTATGLETHWFTPPSKELASIIHQNIVAVINSPDRGIMNSMFYVIHHSCMPSILAEIGFISNNAEKDQLLTEKRKEDTARAISNGIIQYLAQDYEKRNRGN